MITPTPPIRSMVTPSRLLCTTSNNPLVYVHSSQTDIRKTFARYVPQTPQSKISWQS